MKGCLNGFTHLGRTGLQVSRLCLGTMNFGPRTSEEDAHAIMDTAHDAGINFFDTANGYGGEPGETEDIVGNWFASGGGRRERTVLATKVYGDMGELAQRRQAVRAQHPPGAGRQLAPAADRLHRPLPVPPRRPGHALGRDLAGHRGGGPAGKILYAGSSNFAGWHIAHAQAAAARRNLIGLVSEQSLYNLLVRDVELEVIPAAQHYGLGVIPWSPLHGGLLGGVIKKESAGVRRLEGRAAQSLAEHRDQIQAYEDLAAEHGVEPGTLGLAWLLTRPAVTAPIIGPRTRTSWTARCAPWSSACRRSI